MIILFVCQSVEVVERISKTNLACQDAPKCALTELFVLVDDYVYCAGVL